MITVFKYDLPIFSDTANLHLPVGAEILCVGSQGQYLRLWAKVDTKENRKTVRRLRISGTGHELTLPDAKHMKFIGTALLDDGALVMHVFEILNPESGER